MKLDHLLTSHKNKFKVDQRLRPETIKITEENRTKWTLLIAIFFGYSSPGKRNKRKYKQMGLHQIKSFFTTKETINKIKRQPNRMGQHVCQYMCYGVNIQNL